MNSAFPISIITVGKGWLVAEKPSGMSVHNDPGRDLRSLLAARVSGDRSLKRDIDFEPDYGFHAVGRLDKEADGLVLLAWRPRIFAALSEQFARHTIVKSYLVVIHGRINIDQTDGGSLNWSWPLSKGAGGRRNPAGKPPRVPCLTMVRTLKLTRHFTLIECRPQTGRKHQIRRHAALAGHPLTGDRRYGAPEACDRLKKLYGFTRIGLHARALTFTPPGSHRSVSVESGGMPASFQALLGAAKAFP